MRPQKTEDSKSSDFYTGISNMIPRKDGSAFLELLLCLIENDFLLTVLPSNK
jgi:hypothetical protein